jgi:hypothetical protein
MNAGDVERVSRRNFKALANPLFFAARPQPRNQPRGGHVFLKRSDWRSRVPMNHLRYVVVRREGEWKIVQAGRRHSGSYPSRRQALCAAIEYAEKDGQPGRRVEVLVREEDGHFLTEWSFGRDLHPDEATQPILTPSR